MPGPDPAMVGGGVLHAVLDVPMEAAAVYGLALRVGRRSDPTVGNRAVATLLLVAGAALAWNIVRHWPAAWKPVGRQLLPVGVAVAGVVWLALLTPAWPGLLLLAVATVDGLPRVWWWRQVSLSDESTIAQFATLPGAVMADVPSTQQMPLPPR